MAVKKTKIQREYANERKKYLARVRYYQKLGYNVEPLPLLKQPKRTSIEKLRQQRGSAIKEAYGIIDFVTGELITRKKEKQETQRKNKELLEELKKKEQVANDIDILEERWNDLVNNCHPRIRELIRERGEFLMRKDKTAFLYGLKKYPDIYPDPLDSRKEVVFSKFKEIQNLMQWLPTSPDYIRFIELVTDNIEKE